MSLNVLFQHSDLYRTAVAVSPVTNWKLYDNVYTERLTGLITDTARVRARIAGHVCERPAGQSAPVHGGGDATCTSNSENPDQRPCRREQARSRMMEIPTGPIASARAITRGFTSSLSSRDFSTRPHESDDTTSGVVGPPPVRSGHPTSGYIRASTWEVRMTYEDIVSLLGYAGGSRAGRPHIMTTDRTEVSRHSHPVSIPTLPPHRGVPPSNRRPTHRKCCVPGGHRGG